MAKLDRVKEFINYLNSKVNLYVIKLDDIFNISPELEQLKVLRWLNPEFRQRIDKLIEIFEFDIADLKPN